MADEAERLAAIVSYERDRERLRAQAAAWRQMAGALHPPVAAVEGHAPASNTPPASQAAVTQARRPAPVVGWLMRRRA
jgi:hypothetical protein